MDEALFTNSSRAKFLSCQKSYEYRYERGLVSIDERDVLTFGSLIHRCLELWHGAGGTLDGVLQLIDQEYPDAAQYEQQRHMVAHARAMMTAYSEAYPHDPWDIIGLEMGFRSKIIEPTTGRAVSRAYFAGQVDGVVRFFAGENGGLCLLEHKTVGRIDQTYLDRLWHAPQTILYQEYMSRKLCAPVTSIVYNLLNSNLSAKQHVGETEAEFEERRAAAQSKNKSGKTTAARRLPETGEEFSARLLDLYRRPGTFQRHEIQIEQQIREQTLSDLVETVHQYRHVKKRGRFLRNRAQCRFGYWNCEYLPVCSAAPEDEEYMIGLCCKHKAPHSELRPPVVVR